MFLPMSSPATSRYVYSCYADETKSIFTDAATAGAAAVTDQKGDGIATNISKHYLVSLAHVLRM